MPPVLSLMLYFNVGLPVIERQMIPSKINETLSAGNVGASFLKIHEILHEITDRYVPPTVIMIDPASPLRVSGQADELPRIVVSKID